MRRTCVQSHFLSSRKCLTIKFSTVSWRTQNYTYKISLFLLLQCLLYAVILRQRLPAADTAALVDVAHGLALRTRGTGAGALRQYMLRRPPVPNATAWRLRLILCCGGAFGQCLGVGKQLTKLWPSHMYLADTGFVCCS